MNLIELIQHEHDEVADLFDRLAAVVRDARRGDEAARVAARLVASARIHSRAEECVFYETVGTLAPQLKGFSLAGPHEHDVLDTTLDKLLVRRPGEDEYPTIVGVARDLFELHARDYEEADTLPLVAEAVGRRQLEALGEAFRAEQARIRPQILRLVGIPARAA